MSANSGSQSAGHPGASKQHPSEVNRPLREGLVALVTGAASGIGAAVARRVAANGGQVVIADIDAAGGQALATEIGGLFVRTDVTNPSDSQVAVAKAVAAYGRLDLVHLNAGICGGSELFDLQRYRYTMSVNVDGVVYGVHAALPQLRAQGGGSIVVTASMAGLAGLPLDPVYAMSKHAVVGLVRSLGPALVEDNISINALCPNFVDTPLIADELELLVARGIPILRAEDVVDVLEDVLSDGSTGKAWLVAPNELSAPFAFAHVPSLPPGFTSSAT